MEELKDSVRDAVRDEIKKQINPPAKQIDEASAASIGGLVTMLLGYAAGGTTMGVGILTGNPLVAVAGAAIGASASDLAGGFVHNLIHDASFKRNYKKLERAIAKRDALLASMDSITGDAERKAYAEKHEREFVKLTKSQQQAAKSLRKMLDNPTPTDELGLSSLSKADRDKLDKLIKVGEKGLITGQVGLAGKTL